VHAESELQQWNLRFSAELLCFDLRFAPGMTLHLRIYSQRDKAQTKGVKAPMRCADSLSS
jgi:hypothetical protein